MTTTITALPVDYSTVVWCGTCREDEQPATLERTLYGEDGSISHDFLCGLDSCDRRSLDIAAACGYTCSDLEPITVQASPAVIRAALVAFQTRIADAIADYDHARAAA